MVPFGWRIDDHDLAGLGHGDEVVAATEHQGAAGFRAQMIAHWSKKVKYGLNFAVEGAREIEDIHQRLNLGMNVFISQDPALARRLFGEKRTFRELERKAAESHLARFAKGGRKA